MGDLHSSISGSIIEKAQRLVNQKFGRGNSKALLPTDGVLRCGFNKIVSGWVKRIS
jgi:hypothetical protein